MGDVGTCPEKSRMRLLTREALPTGEELERRARELGVDVLGGPATRSSSGDRRQAPDHELQRRVIEAERARRESNLWVLAVLSTVLALLSAIAAALSAGVALYAVARG